MAQIQYKTKSVQLTEETWNRIEEIAKNEDTSTAAIIRRLCLEGINKPIKGDEKMSELKEKITELQIENHYLTKKIDEITHSHVKEIMELRNLMLSITPDEYFFKKQ